MLEKELSIWIPNPSQNSAPRVAQAFCIQQLPFLDLITFSDPNSFSYSSHFNESIFLHLPQCCLTGGFLSASLPAPCLFLFQFLQPASSPRVAVAFYQPPSPSPSLTFARPPSAKHLRWESCNTGRLPENHPKLFKSVTFQRAGLRVRGTNGYKNN